MNAPAPHPLPLSCERIEVPVSAFRESPTFAALLVSALVLTACTTPVPTRELVVPSYGGTPPAQLAILAIDRRPYVLSGVKNPGFEGLFRSGFGIPYTYYRPYRPEREGLAHRFAVLLRDSFWDVGTLTSLIHVPEPATQETALDQFELPHGEPAVLLEIAQSRFDVMRRVGFDYDYALSVVSPQGDVLAHKRITGESEVEKRRRLSRWRPEYELWDLFSMVYEEKLELLLNDPAIRSALAAVSSPPVAASGPSAADCEQCVEEPVDGSDPAVVRGSRSQIQAMLGGAQPRCQTQSPTEDVCSWSSKKKAQGWKELDGKVSGRARGLTLVCMFGSDDSPGECRVRAWRESEVSVRALAMKRRRESRRQISIMDAKEQVEHELARSARRELRAARTLSTLSGYVGETPTACEPSGLGQLCTWEPGRDTPGTADLKRTWRNLKSDIQLLCQLPRDGSPRRRGSCTARRADQHGRETAYLGL